MSLKFLVYVGIIYAVAYPFAARVWRNLRRPLEALSEQERRLVPLWRRQAIGIGVATVTLAAGVVLFAAPVAPYIPFWSIYAWVTLVGVGALITVHAKALESRISAPIAKRLPVTASARYDIAWKVALVGCFTAFFASLSVTSFSTSAWLGHPLLVATYVLLGSVFILAALAGWTRKRG